MASPKLSDAKPLDVDKFIGKTKQRIYRIGVELEGGWVKLPEGSNGPQRDGSIHLEIPADPNGRKPNVKVGEIVSDVIEPEKLSAFVKQHYPQYHNATCGLHLHMSFKSHLHYQLLMVPEYQATIFDYVSRWAKKNATELTGSHPIWERLTGSNQFCLNQFHPDAQAVKTRKQFDHGAPGSRYTAINYPFGLVGTVECRLLPMLPHADMAISALQNVMDITNAFLVASRRDASGKLIREDKLEIALADKADPILDNEEIYAN